MINLVSRDEKRNLELAKWRKVVTAWTTLVLGVYLIAIAAFFGWWWYWTAKQKASSKKVESLKQEIRMLSENEALARKIVLRARAVNEFLANRENASAESKLLLVSDKPVVEWDLKPGSQLVVVSASDSAALKEYENYMTEHYSSVLVEQVNWDTLTGWTLSLMLSGRKEK